VVRHLKTRLHNVSSTLGLALQFTVQRVDENVPIRRASPWGSAGGTRRVASSPR